MARRWRVGAVVGRQRHVAGVNQKTGFTFKTYFVGAVEVISDDRFAAATLRQRADKRFKGRQVGEEVHDADITLTSPVAQPGEENFALEAERADLVFNFIPQGAVAHQQQPRVRSLRQDFWNAASRSRGL